jgi:uncharacterized protein YodC (DUF2158 family)
MKPSKFKAGDVVKLKSGGPAMTIVGYREVSLSNNKTATEFLASWFDTKGILQDGQFFPHMLEAV